jgi:hypothetical protein
MPLPRSFMTCRVVRMGAQRISQLVAEHGHELVLRPRGSSAMSRASSVARCCCRVLISASTRASSSRAENGLIR